MLSLSTEWMLDSSLSISSGTRTLITSSLPLTFLPSVPCLSVGENLRPPCLETSSLPTDHRAVTVQAPVHGDSPSSSELSFTFHTWENRSMKEARSLSRVVQVVSCDPEAQT